MPPDQPFDDWADIYDAVYAYLDYDLSFYVHHATASGGPVLELGCGTGRVSLAIAGAGIDVLGIDISPRMVEAARRKARSARLDERAVFDVGDMADLRLDRTFGLAAMPFRSFHSMLTVEDQRAALDNAARHLAPGGLLVFDTFNPDIRTLTDSGDGIPFHVRDVEQPNGGNIVIWGQNSWDGVTQINSARLIIEELDAGGVMQRRLYRDFDQRYTFRYEMEHLLELCGFHVEDIYGDFDGGDVTEDSDDLVWVARRV
ncbi:MAG: class I SAM-dependent methyltransferase [Dehalococcoidia bacterium]